MVAIINRIITVLSSLAMILLFGLVLFIVAELISRNYFNFGIPGAVEITEYLIAYIAFLGAPWLLKENGHVNFSLIIDRLSFRKRVMASVTSNIIGFISTSIIGIIGLLQIISFYNRNVMAETVLGLPLAVLLSIVPISFLLIAAQFIIKVFNSLGRFQHKHIEKGDL